jgi:hypothetical protein
MIEAETPPPPEEQEHWARGHLPERLLKRFDAVVNDPELISVRALLGLTGVRITELLEKIPSQESGEAWRSIGQGLHSLERVIQLAESLDDADRVEIQEWVDHLKDFYRSAKNERAVWKELFDVIERARRLADTETSRERVLQANLTSQQAIALFNKLFHILAAEVPDPDQRARIGLQLRGLLAPSPERVLPGLDVIEGSYEIVE